MLKFNEIENLYNLLQSSREKALFSGDYETSIEEHDQVIRQCNKLQQLTDNQNIKKKFEIIKEKCRLEMKIFQDLLKKLQEIKKSMSSNNHNSNFNDYKLGLEDEKIDPEVWAPPTPIQSNKRHSDDNLPSWARNPAIQQNNPRGGGGGDAIRRQSNEEANSKPRRKDPIPENRRRYFFSYLLNLF